MNSKPRGGGFAAWGGRARAAARAAAFTLTELLVVIVIIVLILAVSVPAFTSIIYSQEATLAQTRLATALRSARDAALQSSGGADTAAVFFFDPGGRARIVTCIKAGELIDRVPGGGGGFGGAVQLVTRDVFVPLETIEPTELPRHWMVRGFVPANTITASGVWYESNAGGVRYGGSTGSESSWVFPETGFFPIDEPLRGEHRQTFMVRFQAGSGVMAPTSTSEVLVLSPRRSGVGRDVRPLWQRADRATDYRRFVQRVLTDRTTAGSAVTAPNDRQDLLGDRSSDTVLARPVFMLAVNDERKLAAALGVALNRETGSLYRPVGVLGNEGPRFVDVPGRTSVQVGQAISQWIGGKTRLDRTPALNTPPDRSTGDQPEARIFMIDRFTGEVRPAEVEP